MKRLHFKHLAFTGSKDRLTTSQKAALEDEIIDHREAGYLWMHNGDCVMSDEYAARMWVKYNGKVMLHPPIADKYRAFFEKATIVCEPREYLVRDHHMVDCSKRLIATPQTFDEQVRSGTWTTVRYARKLRLGITIVLPDGSIRRE